MNNNVEQSQESGGRGPPGVAWHRVEQDHVGRYQSIMDEMLDLVDVNNNAFTSPCPSS